LHFFLGLILVLLGSRFLSQPESPAIREDGLSAGSCAALDLHPPLFGLDDQHVSAEGRLAGSLGFADHPSKGRYHVYTVCI